MKKKLLGLLLLIANGATYAQNIAFKIDSVAVVGEGTVSSKDFEFKFSPAGDHSIAFFSKALLPDWRRISIVYTRQNKGQWQQPVLAPFSGVYRDADPFIAPNQKRLYFISDRPSKFQKNKSDYSFWYVEAPFEKATEPVLVEGDFYRQFPKNPLYPSVSENGNLYFSAIDSTGDSDIYFVKSESGTYGLAIKLSFNQPKVFDLDPVIAPDESFIIFSSTTRKGYGGSDLYISFHKGQQWTDPVNLGDKINSIGNEGQAGLSADGKTIYFSSVKNKTVTDYAPRAKRISQAEFEKELLSPFNGLPNIWKAHLRILQ